MNKFEYKIYDQKDGVNPDDEVGLNYLGNKGWELVAIRKSDSKYGGYCFYFKRLIEATSESEKQAVPE